MLECDTTRRLMTDHPCRTSEHVEVLAPGHDALECSARSRAGTRHGDPEQQPECAVCQVNAKNRHLP